jgi:rubredoxin
MNRNWRIENKRWVDICRKQKEEGSVAHWICTTCGYSLQSSAPPERCSSCGQVCAFNDVTSYQPGCSGEQNIDPLAVGSTLRVLKGGPQPAAKPKSTFPSLRPPLDKILGRDRVDTEDLADLSFWPIPEVDILRGLTQDQRGQIKHLGDIEYYEPNVSICTEGERAYKLFLVEEGRVAVESRVVTGMRFPISIVCSGQAFGWSALVSPYLYTASVVSLSNTRIIAIEREALLSRMRANPSIGLSIMENIASIVCSRLRILEMQLARLLQQGH